MKPKLRTWKGYAVEIRGRGVLCTPLTTGGKGLLNTPSRGVFRTKKLAEEWCGTDEHGRRIYRVFPVRIIELASAGAAQKHGNQEALARGDTLGAGARQPYRID